MKILGLTQKFSGCGYHRIMLPVSLMEKEKGRITDTITDETFETKWDIVFINRLWKNDLIELRKQHSFKLVVDVDDYWILDHDHLDYDNYKEHNVAQITINNIREADLVTCTHERLAERIKPYNNNILIVPNAIPYGKMQFTEQKTEDELTRLIWVGGISHENDLKILQKPLNNLLKSDLADKVQMILGGYCDTNETEKRIWGAMANYFTAGGNLINTSIRGMDVFNYYTMYNFSDIALIPLRKSMFNVYKSNLKILEAAGKGIPVIVSSVHPYLGFPEDLVNYADDSSMWNHWINKLVRNPQIRIEQGAELKAYCEKHYNFESINKERELAFRSLLAPNIVNIRPL